MQRNIDHPASARRVSRGALARARVVSALFAALVLTTAGLNVGPAAVHAAPTWAPAATAPVHPGVQTFTEGGQCTANFVFYGGEAVYIGQAAHCASTGAQTDTDGCTSTSLPLGTEVTVTGAEHPGTLVYSSWVTMQERGETDADTCAYNDLALVELDPADAGNVNPSIPRWGGPTGVNTAGAPQLSSVYSYGNSELRFGITQLSPKTGISLGDTGDGWEHEVSTITPGIPGDSGSAFLDPQGRALGILSTLQIGAPNGVSNGVGDVAREIAYAQTVAGFENVTLALGTEPFNANPLPI
jgi:hypothetical protein